MTSHPSIASEETALLGGCRTGGQQGGRQGRGVVAGGAPLQRGPIRIGEGDDDNNNNNNNINDDEDDDGASSENEEAEQQDCSRDAWLLRFFSLVSALAAVASVVLLLSQLASVLVFSDLGLIQTLLRAYVAVFCVLFLLAEMRVELFLDRAASFQSWFQRGFLYTWVGVMGVEESVAALGQAYPKYPGVSNVAISTLLRASSFAVFGVGVLYMLMSVFCLRSVWEDLHRQQQQPFD
jgi:hypothetical protein